MPAGHVLGEPVVKTKHLSANWTHVGEILAIAGGRGGGRAGGGGGAGGGGLGHGGDTRGGGRLVYICYRDLGGF